MKKLIFAALIATATSGAIAQITIPLGDSGYYGRIDIVGLGAPPVIYREPIVVERTRDYRPVEPIYLRVPPGHAKNWRRHCAAYDACHRPVYFVEERWYTDTYVPRYRGHHGERDFDKERAKDRREAIKEREKDRREHEKELAKDRREAIKEYEKDRREALKEYEKDRREAQKEYEKNRYKDD